jgi:hypothetical protein
MIIRTFTLKIATQDHVTQKEIEEAVEHGLDVLSGAQECLINMIEERGSRVDANINPWGTIEESNEWSALANKELSQNG